MICFVIHGIGRIEVIIMAAFSYDYECNGKSMNWYEVAELFYKALNDGLDTDDIYWGVLIKNYNGKNIEIKITDIEKEKEYKEKLKRKGFYV